MSGGIAGSLKRAVAQTFPTQYRQLQYWQMYRRATASVGDHKGERDQRFREMVARSLGKPALQIGVRDAKYAPHWVSVDLYDPSPLIDYHYDVMNMPFEDGKFEFVACLAVLEHVPEPQKAIAELGRVLKPGGEIWVEIPFNQPYHPSPSDYWRVSPDGMRVWMGAFEERALGLFAPSPSAIYNGIYFHGVKPAPMINRVSQHPLVKRISRDRNLSDMLKHSGIMYASGIITIALTFVQQITTAKLLGPADYGRVATVIGIAMFLLLILDVRTWELGTKLLARPVIDNQHLESIRIISWLMVVDTCIGTFGAILLIVFADPIAALLLKDASLAPLVRIYAISLPFREIGTSGPLALVRLRDRFDWLSVKSIVYSAARLVLLTGPALLGLGITGVIIGAVIGEFVNMASQLLMLVLLWRKMPGVPIFDLTKPKQFTEGRKLLTGLWVSATLQGFQLESFIPLTALFCSPVQVGILRSGFDVSNLINSLTQPLSIVLSPGVIKTYEISPGPEFRRLLKQATGLLALLAVPLTLGIIVLGPFVLPRLLGAGFDGIGPVAAMLALAFGFNAVFLWLRPVIVAMKLISQQNILSFLSVIVSTVLLVIMAPRYGALGSALAGGVTMLIYTAILLAVVVSYVRGVRAPAVATIETSPPSPLPASREGEPELGD